jgi:hypothetical protein
MTLKADRQHEVAFCSEVSKWSDQLFQSNSSLPFGSSDIESFGRGSQKRQDFRVYERASKGRGKLALCGEVKLPGTQQGRSPFDPALMKDAYEKATNANCQYFFTWNVEHLALFDRALWDADTMHERCVGQWELGLELNQPSDVMRAEVIARLRDRFLPTFYTAFSNIWTGHVTDVSLPPSDFYITVLESHLAGPMGPVRELRDYLGLQSDQNAAFDARLREWMTREQQWNFNRSDPDSWRKVIDRAARSMVYVLSNRILFYQAVRLRNDLPELEFPRRAKRNPKSALEYLHGCFEEAVEKTGDYEPVFFPEGEKEWAALMALSGTNSLDAWDRTIRAIDRFNFKEIPTDILGHVFQKLISPEERHKFGQHYTDEDIVDLINAFCIRKGDAAVLDPACGSGSFLVRAYYRKFELDKRLTNQELLEGIYGCDINPFPAHLATLNLAARNIANEENYPRIARRNFFTVGPGKPFCAIPIATGAYEGRTGRTNIQLPSLEAVVGNPPYVRHEEIPKESELKRSLRDQSKEHIYETAEKPWPDLNLSKQSDLHVYFWPVAAQFLKEDGWFGFLTSSSWLDARYGFALQRWILQNFRLVAAIESVDEPWFEDARVKTAATILQRCDDATKRDDNLVKFVQLKRPLAEILGNRADESQKQEAAEKFRDYILKKKSDFSNNKLRIMVKRQADLWDEGLSVAAMFKRQKDLAHDLAENVEENDDSETNPEPAKQAKQSDELFSFDYGGGKWGRYLRAPDLYFDMIREFGDRFTRLGEIATIKFGIKSGCDAFFMPRNVSAKLLAENESEQEWKDLPLMRRCKREQVVSGNVVIVQCGDKTLHPVEAKYLRPEVHSLMKVDRPLVSEKQLDRVVLWVDETLPELKSSYVHDFIIWGSKQTFASNKSKAVPVPKRATCAGRNPWYDVTGLIPGIGFWPMAQQYRHIIPANPQQLVCNHNLFDIHALDLDEAATRALMPILNSTLAAFIKPYYGRYAGTEGNLKTEVVDTILIEVPDPRNVTAPVLRRLESAFSSMQKREVTHMLEETFRACHTADEVREAAKLPLGLPLELQREDRRELDDAVFELLGVSNAGRRQELIDHLYREVSLHYRSIRIVEVQKMEQRRHGGNAKISTLNLASSAWNELDPEWQKPLADWVREQVGKGKVLDLPDGDVRLPDSGHFFEANTVYFGKAPVVSLICESRAEAELVAAIARAGLRGEITVPITEKESLSLTRQLESRLEIGMKKIGDLANQYAGTDKVRDQVAAILEQQFIVGKPEI